MSALQELLSRHHHHCDDLFAKAEKAADEKDWETCLELAQRFVSALDSHFRSEEEDLFPAFESATGMSAGPTAVMRSEHAQMRSLVAALITAARERNSEDYFGTSETLLVFMEQHNRKEEGILYPMCDQRIAEAESLASNIEATLEQ